MWLDTRWVQPAGQQQGPGVQDLVLCAGFRVQLAGAHTASFSRAVALLGNATGEHAAEHKQHTLWSCHCLRRATDVFTESWLEASHPQQPPEGITNPSLSLPAPGALTHLGISCTVEGDARSLPSCECLSVNLFDTVTQLCSAEGCPAWPGDIRLYLHVIQEPKPWRCLSSPTRHCHGS